MVRVIYGKVHGKTIELDEDLGLAEGQEVEVRVEPLPTSENRGEGLRRSAGALADEWTEEDDRIWEEIHQARKGDRRRETPQ